MKRTPSPCQVTDWDSIKNFNLYFRAASIFLRRLRLAQQPLFSFVVTVMCACPSSSHHSSVERQRNILSALLFSLFIVLPVVLRIGLDGRLGRLVVGINLFWGVFWPSIVLLKWQAIGVAVD